MCGAPCAPRWPPGGELVKLHHVRRKRRQPRVVVLVDVSRSMEVHAQFFLRLSRAFVEVMEARAFVFHTRLAEVTPLLKRRSERVQEKVNAVTFGFGGGTRIASCLHEAVHQHLGRSLARGDLFMVFSDGFDTDEPEALADGAGAGARSRRARLLAAPDRGGAQIGGDALAAPCHALHAGAQSGQPVAAARTAGLNLLLINLYTLQEEHHGMLA